MIVGNKMDLKDAREVTYAEAKELADNHRFSYMECSAKSGESVEEVFL
jgi:GTPase SAR1 family protein